jgi:aspartyl-tRNA synthetase
MERYGTDRPDLRYALDIRDVSGVFRGVDFGITRSALDRGGRVRGIVVTGGAALSRKQVDEIEAEAKNAGALGLLRLKSVDGRLEGPAAKFLGQDAGGRLGLKDGDLGLYVAGPDSISNQALDRVRQDVARRRGLVDEAANAFVWITDFPLFLRDDSTGTLVSVHHPFTAPHVDDLEQLEAAPDRVRAQAYDLVHNGTELGGGSIRIADPSVQSKVFALLGIEEDAARARFGFLLEGLRSGAPPHGGIAFGFDRIVMKLAPAAASLRDVIAFPKTTAARALFEGAPAPVPVEDLEELGVIPGRAAAKDLMGFS